MNRDNSRRLTPFVFLIALLTLATTTFAETLTVFPPMTKAVLRVVIETADPGDTIQFQGSSSGQVYDFSDPFEGPIVIDKALTLEAANVGQKPVLDATGSGATGIVVQPEADQRLNKVVIDGLVFRNFGRAVRSLAGPSNLSFNQWTVQNNECYSTVRCFQAGGGVASLIVRDNLVHDSAVGILIFGDHHGNVTNNQFEGCGFAVLVVDDTKPMLVHQNQIGNCDTGLLAAFSTSNTTFLDNTIRDSLEGILLSA